MKLAFLRAACVLLHADDSQSSQMVLALVSTMHATTDREMAKRILQRPEEKSPTSRSPCLFISPPYELMT